MSPRHSNRPFRTRIGTPPPETTLAAAEDYVDVSDSVDSVEDVEDLEGDGYDEYYDFDDDFDDTAGHEPFAGREPGAGRVELTLLGVAGVSLVAATVIGSPWISVLTLPAALLAPGQVVLRSLGRGLVGRGLAAQDEPWLLWALRLVLSLAVWTVLGAVFVVLPLLDPRFVGLLIGVVLTFLALTGLDRRAGPGRERPPPLWRRSSASTADGSGRASGARARIVVLVVFALVAAASIGGAYLISVGGSPAQPFVSLSLQPATGLVYDATGRIRATTTVHNASDAPLTLRLVVTLDGRRRVDRRLRLAAGASLDVPLDPVRTTPCWRLLTVAVTGAPTGLAPRALDLHGPGTDLSGCTPSPSP